MEIFSVFFHVFSGIFRPLIRNFVFHTLCAVSVVYRAPDSIKCMQFLESFDKSMQLHEVLLIFTQDSLSII